MNKELELFKRWFGIELPEGSDIKTHEGVYKDYDYAKLAVYINSDLLDKKFLSDIIEIDGFERIYMNYWEEELYFIFKIPAEYGLVEWEQYVKEMKDE